MRSCDRSVETQNVLVDSCSAEISPDRLPANWKPGSSCGDAGDGEEAMRKLRVGAPSAGYKPPQAWDDGSPDSTFSMAMTLSVGRHAAETMCRWKLARPQISDKYSPPGVGYGHWIQHYFLRTPTTMSPTSQTPSYQPISSVRTSTDDFPGAVRKRVRKACDRRRMKKARCDGMSPCLRCKTDNAICCLE